MHAWHPLTPRARPRDVRNQPQTSATVEQLEVEVKRNCEGSTWSADGPDRSHDLCGARASISPSLHEGDSPTESRPPETHDPRLRAPASNSYYVNLAMASGDVDCEESSVHAHAHAFLARLPS